ncbi:MAG TPA: hypothetical protein PKJ99_15825 [Thermoanaerobaculales bacterium]|nr:hypothetical protein [Thermoanaerobaculales bacterium]HPA81540.1 hypothetical protein [Thermoanaerobaculales bacterium]HQL31501.1 hypothetical protein [Thermoanaerobaculales bacterium]HQN96586.1 hypothetical protein [Thermoanaerobaculales bacterium]HQP44190.1 hypothetical protein [Thermoanaerobaculales bacterium]
MSRAAACAFVAALVAASAAGAATKEMRINLRIEPDLKLDGSEKIYIGPVLIEQRGGGSASSTDLEASREFDDYLRKVLRRKTRLDVVPPLDGLELPTTDPLQLAKMPQFWIDLGAATDADYIVAASIDVKVLDRAGYNTEEYVSPTDGKTYFRQVLVEETGFNFDILLTVYDGDTGEQVLSEQITDFKERSDRKLEQTQDMFAELYNLDNRLLGVFVPRSVVAKRTLYTD